MRTLAQTEGKERSEWGILRDGVDTKMCPARVWDVMRIIQLSVRLYGCWTMLDWIQGYSSSSTPHLLSSLLSGEKNGEKLPYQEHPTMAVWVTFVSCLAVEDWELIFSPCILMASIALQRWKRTRNLMGKNPFSWLVSKDSSVLQKLRLLNVYGPVRTSQC